VYVNPVLAAELRLSNWAMAAQGQHVFWTMLRGHMAEQFARIGLARELMLPLSFDIAAIKFGFATLSETERFASLHDNQRWAGMYDYRFSVKNIWILLQQTLRQQPSARLHLCDP
jgi:hypothetical protein